MKIFNSEQIKQWDWASIEAENISSSELMYRASKACINYILSECDSLDSSFFIVCGKGNNGGDGLSIARILFKANFKVQIYLSDQAENLSEDAQFYYKKLEVYPHLFVQEIPDNLPANTLIIDALFGIGLNKVLNEKYRYIINKINALKNKKISIDIASGLSPNLDPQNNFDCFVHAHKVLSFMQPKLSFFLPEKAYQMGEFEIIDIGLNSDFYLNNSSQFNYINFNSLAGYLPKREKISHKGNFGKAFLFGGSSGMAGALTFSSWAASRSGLALGFICSSASQENLFQKLVPDFMFKSIEDLDLNQITDSYHLIGPGLGQSSQAKELVQKIINLNKPIIIDADALNIIGAENMLDMIPENSVITPHIKEFDRLFGQSDNFSQRIIKAQQFSSRKGIYIVLKNFRTFIFAPNGDIFINSTGAPSLAKGGSGDVLAGCILGLINQNMSPLNALKLAVYTQGKASENLLKKWGDYGMKQKELCDEIAVVLKDISDGYERI